MKYFLLALSIVLFFTSTEASAETSVGNNASTYPNTSMNYGEAQKMEMQNKSTAMRIAKYTELKTKGVDVSVLTPDTLDASKTDEGKFWDAMRIIEKNRDSLSRAEYVKNLTQKWVDTSTLSPDLLDAFKTDSTAFWNAMKSIQQAGEIKSRKEYLAKIAGQGADISGFTDAIIADGTAFWDLAKKVQSVPPTKSIDRPYPMAKSDSGTLATELAYMKKMVEEMKAKGIDTSRFTDEVMANKEAFTKLVRSLQWTESTKMPPKKEPPQTLPPVKDTTTPIKETNGSLSEKTRSLFQARLDKIPEEMKISVLTRLESVIMKQIDLATSKSNTKLVTKLQEMLQIVQDKRDDTLLDDSMMIPNSMMN